MSYTKQEREILDSWPTVTAQDLEAMNGLFSHYLFFSRAGDLMGLSGINLWASCCGHKDAFLRSAVPGNKMFRVRSVQFCFPFPLPHRC